jgi:hypothetical protein
MTDDAPIAPRPAPSVMSFLKHYARGRADVPCRQYGCVGCCRTPDMRAMLEPHELERGFDTETMPDGARVIAKRPDGTCTYLGDDGCMIYADRPAACRTFDCRAFSLARASWPNNPEMNQVVRSWQWRTPTTDDLDAAAAFRAAVADARRRHPRGESAVAEAMVTWRRFLDAARRARLKVPASGPSRRLP